MAISKKRRAQPIEDTPPAVEIPEPEPQPVVTRPKRVETHQQPIVCQNCGHVYLEPCITQDSLDQCRNWKWAQDRAKKEKVTA